ncbi:phosphoenolpyruvate carboxylase [Tanacetum coccineum]
MLVRKKQLTCLDFTTANMSSSRESKALLGPPECLTACKGRLSTYDCNRIDGIDTELADQQTCELFVVSYCHRIDLFCNFDIMGAGLTYLFICVISQNVQASKSCDDTFNQLIQSGLSPDVLYDTVCNQHLLEVNDRKDLTQEDQDSLIEDLVREITSIWQTDELRHHNPTLEDEARAGLNYVEQSLWKAIPHYLRRLSNALKKVAKESGAKWKAMSNSEKAPYVHYKTTQLVHLLHQQRLRAILVDVNSRVELAKKMSRFGGL